jgi:hypothetical protein
MNQVYVILFIAILNSYVIPQKDAFEDAKAWCEYLQSTSEPQYLLYNHMPYYRQNIILDVLNDLKDVNDINLNSISSSFEPIFKSSVQSNSNMSATNIDGKKRKILDLKSVAEYILKSSSKRAVKSKRQIINNHNASLYFGYWEQIDNNDIMNTINGNNNQKIRVESIQFLYDCRSHRHNILQYLLNEKQSIRSLTDIVRYYFDTKVDEKNCLNNYECLTKGKFV